MALFQKSVLNKYLKTLDEKKVNEAYQKLTAFFHNETIIENIREDKEEQFQYGFLQKLFDEVLDYTINPNPDYNLTTEFKNLKGAKKADGALLKDGKAIGVIELKSTKTKELSKITDQAFGYKNNHPTCSYIITSNFEKLRFYIEDATEYLDFNLFTLTIEEFKLLYLCLHKDHILSDLPQRIKKDSAFQEDNITKKLYKDYSAFKKALFNDMVMNNPAIPKLDLFKKSQKLIDRFLFIFFAEDKGLLPPNSVTKIVKTYDALENLDSYKPLYEVFQQYFGYINSGRPAKGERAEIFAYNGGLFAADEMLDNLKVTDNILMNHTLVLSRYDFESEVDVNILGHIFEHSLNEIDEMTAEIEGQAIEKNKTKRKKDGVFYTPKYITKYIVDNTVGKLCEAHKETLGLKEEEYRPKRNKATKKRLLEDLEAYRSYLLSLTICDPACGSGAFLNQALDFLIKEHRYIDELQTKLLGGSIILSDITNDILEKNIYGVDINQEAVDIARLSMWLRTAQKERTLTTLSDNIKCGNSLIDDSEVAKDKAFVWEKEFPDVFNNGGFDVIIGNPPYVRLQNIDKKSISHFNEKYKSAYKNYDLYVLFVEAIKKFINSNGIASFIMPTKFINTEYGKKSKNFISENNLLKSFIDFADFQVFKDAITYTGIFIFDKKPKIKIDYFKVTDVEYLSLSKVNYHTIPYKNLASDKWIFLEEIPYNIFQKITTHHILSTYTKNLFVGLQTSADPVFILEKRGEKLFSKHTEKEYKFNSAIIKPLLKGAEIKRYTTPIPNYQIIFPYKIDGDNFCLIPQKEMEKDYPLEWTYLNECSKKLKNRENGKMNNKKWYGYVYLKNMTAFEKPKILTQVLCKHSSLTIDLENKFYFVGGGTAGGYGITISENQKIPSYTLLAILNSTLIQWYLHLYASPFKGGFYAYNKGTLGEVPIPEKAQYDNSFTEIIKNLIVQNDNLYSITKKGIKLFKRRLNLSTLSKNLQNWPALTFTEFTKELKKKKIKLSLSDEEKWEEYFLEKKEEAQVIKAVIDKTDKEIDRMVYDLYGLTEEEIGIVENS